MKYTKQTAVTGEDFIVRDNENGTISWIPTNEDNADYQAYLESLEPKAKASKVVDEAAPE